MVLCLHVISVISVQKHTLVSGNRTEPISLSQILLHTHFIQDVLHANFHCILFKQVVNRKVSICTYLLYANRKYNT